MLDETIITEPPPLYSCYGHIGQQVRMPITGNRSKRILHGAITVKTGDVSLLITKEWTRETHQGFLSMSRSHWRGWDLVLSEDRASQHTAPDSLSAQAEAALPHLSGRRCQVITHRNRAGLVPAVVCNLTGRICPEDFRCHAYTTRCRAILGLAQVSISRL